MSHYPHNPDETNEAIFQANLNPFSGLDLALFKDEARAHLQNENYQRTAGGINRGPEETMARREVVLDRHLEPKVIRGAVAGAVLALLVGFASEVEPNPVTLLAIPAGVAAVGAMADQRQFRGRAQRALPEFFEPPRAKERQRL